MKRVLKWTVAVDDHDHPIGSGPVVLVDVHPTLEHRAVNVWTEEDGGRPPTRRARVYGTGQPVQGTDQHLGSVQVITPAGVPLVWHVYAEPQ